MRAETLGKRLARPTWSAAGWLLSRFVVARDRLLEENAVQLIQPGEAVHGPDPGPGPGLGLGQGAHRSHRAPYRAGLLRMHAPGFIIY